MRVVYGFIFALVLTVAAGSVFGVITRTFIEFGQYDKKIIDQFPDPKKTYITNIDGVPKAVLGYMDFMLSNWVVELNDSAAFLENRILSYIKPVDSKKFGLVMGVRVHFPTWNNNCYAVIKPPFAMKIYNEQGSFANAENGVMPNAWEIKAISIWVNGRNYNNQISLRLLDRDKNVFEAYFGSLFFNGWRKLTWVNPNFTEKMYAKSLKKVPLYPKDIPYLVFDSFVIYRLGSEIGGDFVTYIHNVEMSYTPYIVDDEVTSDINDEAVWGIITMKGKKDKELEDKMLTEDIILYEQEKYRIELEQKELIPYNGGASTN
ncbi:MAG: hypothetical protein A2Y33_14135 [Spirochaetes bacterium GWF1_51_8]|nr:MAG: hypothetical protein A2Y33_14135 [Spirochaetes bacterium GWF1_51_8]